MDMPQAYSPYTELPQKRLNEQWRRRIKGVAKRLIEASSRTHSVVVEDAFALFATSFWGRRRSAVHPEVAKYVNSRLLAAALLSTRP